MSKNNGYWYFRMERNFFEDQELKDVKHLFSGDLGYKYLIIYLEMCCLALKQGGDEVLLVPMKSIHAGYAPYIANYIGESVQDVEATIDLMVEYGYIKIGFADNHALLGLKTLKNNTGHSSVEADRKREQRNQKGIEGVQLLPEEEKASPLSVFRKEKK